MEFFNWILDISMLQQKHLNSAENYESYSFGSFDNAQKNWTLARTYFINLPLTHKTLVFINIKKCTSASQTNFTSDQKWSCHHLSF